MYATSGRRKPQQMRPQGQSERLLVILKSRDVLLELMKFHGITTAYALARKANLKPGAVGHLVSGRRHTCSADTARAIERAFECPTGFLFDLRVSPVASNPRQYPPVQTARLPRSRAAA